MTIDRFERIELIRRQGMDDNGFGPQVMMRLKVCPHCGGVGAASQFFCKVCGHALPQDSLYQRYREKHRCCPVCDTVLPDAAQYCPQCGELIGQPAV